GDRRRNRMGIALLIATVATIAPAIAARARRPEVASLDDEIERLRSELHIVSGLARDLKGPLQGDLGNTELMIAAGESPSTNDELRDIHYSAEKAAGIVRTMLAV